MGNGEIAGDLARRLESLSNALGFLPDSTDPWSSSFDRKEYGTALARLEEELSKEPSAVRNRLWWIILQLHLEQVPVTALSAPADDLHSTLKSSPELSIPACAANLRLATRLIERSQLRLAVMAIERAVQLGASDGALEARKKRELLELFQSALKQELERAELRRESREYQESLRSRLEQTAKLLAQVPAESKKTEANAKRRSPVIDAKAILAQSAEEVQPVAAPSEEKRSSRRVGLIAVVAVGVVLLALFLRGGDTAEESMLTERTAIATEARVEPTLVATQLALKGSSNGRGDAKLDQITERLQRIEPGHAASEGAPEEKKPEETAPSFEPQSDHEPAGIDTFGKTGEPQAPPGKTPELNPDRVPQEQVDLGMTGKAPNTEGLKVGSDGRVFGPPVPPSTPLRDPKGSGYVRPQAVEQFRVPARYRTITHAKVLSAPSMTAVTITELKPQSNIQVVARMGIWLELRSATGRRGYIYAQDAERLP